jgi:hypothetical protein
LGANVPLKGKVAYRRILLVFGTIALIAVCLHAAVAVYAANELTSVEPIIAMQARALADHGTLYYDLRNYPYTVCAYMPSFYFLEAALYRLGVPLLQAGRLISLSAFLAILWLLFRTIELYTGDKDAAWTGVVLAGLTQQLVAWGTVAQTDMLSIACGFAAVYLFSRYHVLGENTIHWSALCALAGLMTKQTAIAAPVAIFLLLVRTRPGKALQFAGIVAGLGGAILLGLNAWTDGRFFFNVLFANLNPFAWYKFQQQVETQLIVGLCLLPIVALGAGKAIRGGLGAPVLYMACAGAVFLATCAKIGSASNYRIELNIALILCTCLALHALDFFPLYFRSSKSWITLLLLPLGIHAVLNIRFMREFLVDEVAYEKNFAAQTATLSPHLAGSGKLLSTDVNAVLRSGRPLLVEPLIYRLLVEAGRVDPTQLNKDLQAGAYSRVLLYEDVNQSQVTDPETPRLTPAQNSIIRERYRLVTRVPGPHFNGLYLYEPRDTAPISAEVR